MSYLSTILSDNPTVVYKLNEPSGTALTDYSPSGDAGVISGTVAYAAAGPPIGDPAMGFTTSGDFAKNTNTLNYSVATVETWAKIPSIPAAVSMIGGFVQANNTSITDKDLEVTTTGKLRFYVYGNNGLTVGPISIDGTTTIADNQWHYLAAVANGTDIRIYVDGVDNQATHPAALSTFAGYAAGQPSVQLGGAQTSSSPAVWQSQTLAYFAVYNTALSASRISAHYVAATVAGTAPSRSLLGVGT